MADNVTDERNDNAVPDDGPVPFWWIALFLLVALGAGVVAISSLGGSVVDSSGGLLVPVWASAVAA